MVDMNTGKILKTILTSSTCLALTFNGGKVDFFVTALLRKLRSSVMFSSGLSSSCLFRSAFNAGDEFVLTAAFLALMEKVLKIAAAST
ncbi:hypothetical protein HanRHA438_Chr16g0742271 [Helianthus annuus]|nr:hypothetical protein HanRHA438_Chr16g0742271 [Helianthus annuus]